MNLNSKFYLHPLKERIFRFSAEKVNVRLELQLEHVVFTHVVRVGWHTDGVANTRQTSERKVILFGVNQQNAN